MSEKRKREARGMGSTIYALYALELQNVILLVEGDIINHKNWTNEILITEDVFSGIIKFQLLRMFLDI